MELQKSDKSLPRYRIKMNSMRFQSHDQIFKPVYKFSNYYLTCQISPPRKFTECVRGIKRLWGICGSLLYSKINRIFQNIFLVLITRLGLKGDSNEFSF